LVSDIVYDFNFIEANYLGRVSAGTKLFTVEILLLATKLPSDSNS
jgi:hypothetical protein